MDGGRERQTQTKKVKERFCAYYIYILVYIYFIIIFLKYMTYTGRIYSNRTEGIL